MITARPSRTSTLSTQVLRGYIKRHNLNITVCKRYNAPVWHLHGETQTIRISAYKGVHTIIHQHNNHKVESTNLKDTLEYVLNQLCY